MSLVQLLELRLDGRQQSSLPGRVERRRDESQLEDRVVIVPLPRFGLGSECANPLDDLREESERVCRSRTGEQDGTGLSQLPAELRRLLLERCGGQHLRNRNRRLVGREIGAAIEIEIVNAAERLGVDSSLDPGNLGMGAQALG